MGILELQQQDLPVAVNGDGAVFIIGKIDDLVPARSLGSVEGCVGALEELFRSPAAFWYHAGGADGEGEVAAGGRRRMFYGELLYADSNASGDEEGVVEGGVGKQDHKLFPTVTCRQVVGPVDAGLDDAGHALQASIPGLVAVVIVEVFEMVDINEKKGDWGVAA